MNRIVVLLFIIISRIHAFSLTPTCSRSTRLMTDPGYRPLFSTSVENSVRKPGVLVLSDLPEEAFEVEDEALVIINKLADIESVDSDQFLEKSFIPTFVLCWFVALLSALDRVAMSVAILPLATEYHLTDAIKGEISSVFSIGYGLAIIPCGLLAAFVSPRLIMGVGVSLWSFATFGTPIAASLIQLTQLPVESLEFDTIPTTSAFIVGNVVPLLFIRAVMGAAESVVLPATQRLLANWVPASRKTMAVAGIISGFQCGTVLAYLISPWVMDNLGGWRGLFYVYGIIGVFWLVPWNILSKDGPVNQFSISNDVITKDSESVLLQSFDNDKNLTEISQNSEWKSAIASIKDAPWSSFAKSQAVWAMMIAHAANNWGLYNMLSWTPTFYSEQYGLNVRDSAFFSIFPSIAGAICGLSAGYIADKIMLSFENQNPVEVRTNVRKIFQGLALLGPAVCLFALSGNIPDDPMTAEALLMGTVGLQAFNAAGYGSSPQEKAGKKWSGLLYSITTLPGVLVGSLGVYVTGQILDLTDQDWSQVFSVNAGIDIFGAIAFIMFYNSKKEFD